MDAEQRPSAFLRVTPTGQDTQYSVVLVPGQPAVKLQAGASVRAEARWSVEWQEAVSTGPVTFLLVHPHADPARAWSPLLSMQQRQWQFTGNEADATFSLFTEDQWADQMLQEEFKSAFQAVAQQEKDVITQGHLLVDGRLATVRSRAVDATKAQLMRLESWVHNQN